jgi:uncharacterized circularly permuted ATP-grasp superfamily protein
MTKSSLSSYDEMLDADGATRAAYSGYCEWLKEQPPELLRRKSGEAEAFFRKTGITFNVYGNEDAEERLIPFDMVPRIINAAQWRRLSRGIEQRVRALNAFLHDLYHRQEIVRSGRLPERVLKGNKAFLPQMAGFTRPAASIPTSSASTLSAPARTISWCSKTMRARPRACRTCSKTAKP